MPCNHVMCSVANGVTWESTQDTTERALKKTAMPTPYRSPIPISAMRRMLKKRGVATPGYCDSVTMMSSPFPSVPNRRHVLTTPEETATAAPNRVTPCFQMKPARSANGGYLQERWLRRFVLFSRALHSPGGRYNPYHREYDQ